jgi:hypothetical protein
MNTKLIILIVFVLITNSCAINKNTSKKTENTFNEFFFMDKRFYSVMKNQFQNKNEILISDSKNVISSHSLNFSNRDLKIKVNTDNNIQDNDLFVKYYKVNKELAYIVFWRNDNNAICFIVTKDNNKWNIADVIFRETR